MVIRLAIVIGLCLVVVIIGIVGWYWLSTMIARRRLQRDHQETDPIYVGTHRIVPAASGSFSFVDHSFYSDTAEALQKAGYTHLGDIEDMTANTLTPLLRSFTAMFLSHDGTTMASVTHIRRRGWMRLLSTSTVPANVKVVDIETELEDGTFLTTSNTEGVTRILVDSSIVDQRCAPDVSIEAMLQRHCDKLNYLTREKGGNSARLHRSLTDCLASQDRLQRHKNRASEARVLSH